MSTEVIVALVYGILFVLVLVALIFVILRRIKEKKDEDFEDRPW